MADPYKLLGISRDADDTEVKKAYRAMSKKYHQDKNSFNGITLFLPQVIRVKTLLGKLEINKC